MTDFPSIPSSPPKPQLSHLHTPRKIFTKCDKYTGWLPGDLLTATQMNTSETLRNLYGTFTETLRKLYSYSSELQVSNNKVLGSGPVCAEGGRGRRREGQERGAGGGGYALRTNICCMKLGILFQKQHNLPPRSKWLPWLLSDDFGSKKNLPQNVISHLTWFVPLPTELREHSFTDQHPAWLCKWLL